MSAGPVTVRYATALFELAREKNALTAVASDVDRIGSELGDPKVSGFLFDARVPDSEKRRALDALASSCSPLTAQFLGLLADKGRLDVLRDLRAAFRGFLLAERNATEGVVESARPLGASELSGLAASLGAVLGKTVELENRVRPELLAGVRVFVDNKLIDHSATGRLDRLRTRMLDARLA